MTDHDVVVATPPNDDDERPDKSIAEQLVEQARADGVDLVGPDGLLAGLTKQVLETMKHVLFLIAIISRFAGPVAVDLSHMKQHSSWF